MKKRKRRQKLANKRVLILCEGLTEKYYFEAMKEDDELKKQLRSVTTDIVDAKGTSPLDIFNEAVKRSKNAQQDGNPYDIIWLVFDHDNEINRKEAHDKAIKANFQVAFSATCFEVWYLLHFKASTRTYFRCDELIKKLRFFYKNYQKAKKNKRESQNHYLELKTKQKSAIRNAAKLRKEITSNQSIEHITDFNPWCDVDKLVTVLMNL